jgi:cytochrome c-type biogenesis protein CcmH/NrfF
MKIRAFILALAFLSMAPSGPDPTDPKTKELYKEACGRLVCQCGCNEPLDICGMQNCSSATPMRSEIMERLGKGESVDAIVQSFVDRLGKKVLSAPTFQGFDLAAWIMPFFVLILATIIVAWIVVRMARPEAAQHPAPIPIDPRVEKELRDFEEES